MAFPTDYLSRPTHEHDKEIKWIDAAPTGAATYVELSLTAETEATVLDAFNAAGHRTMMEFVGFPSGQAFFAAFYHDEWDNNDLRVPGEGKVNDLMFSANDPFDTGRPVRIRIQSSPQDGDAVLIKELGGYAVQAKVVGPVRPAGRLAR